MVSGSIAETTLLLLGKQDINAVGIGGQRVDKIREIYSGVLFNKNSLVTRYIYDLYAVFYICYSYQIVDADVIIFR